MRKAAPGFGWVATALSDLIYGENVRNLHAVYEVMSFRAVWMESCVNTCAVLVFPAIFIPLKDMFASRLITSLFMLHAAGAVRAVSRRSETTGKEISERGSAGSWISRTDASNCPCAAYMITEKMPNIFRCCAHGLPPT